MTNRPKITDNIVYEIKQLIKNNPEWNRSRLSIELCELWDWKNEAGRICDISCRDMLRDLDDAGRITLPKPIKSSRRIGSVKKPIHLMHDTTVIDTPLSEIKPLQINVITKKDENIAFKSYISQYHYLGYDRYIGESINYAVRSRDGVPLASLMFGSSAWKCRPRDEFIGWNKEQRIAKLRYTANNQRFLIYPWIRVPHLASNILGAIARRISNDWVNKYGHGLILLETFVEQHRFRAVCYRAANWIRVGETTGRGRNSTSHKAVLPIKDVYVYPLAKGYRELLCAKLISE